MAELRREREDDAVESLEVRAMAVERLTFFADAVIAIAITLLALELPLPAASSNRELLHFFREHRDEYLAFAISFWVIGAYWSAHHRTFRWVTALGGRLTRLTLIWLMLQVLMPYATRLLTGEGAFQGRFIPYAGIQVLAATLFILMVLDLRKYRLTRDDTPPTLLRDAAWRSAILALGFGLSIPLSFVSQPVAYACWFVIPVGRGLIYRLWRRRQPARSAASRP
jgi:TMEM175 potassium channel family protein